MKEKIFISLSGRNQAWFDKKSKKEQAEYLKAHPNSKFGKGTAKKSTTKKPATKKAAPKKKAKVVRKIVPHKDTEQMHSHALQLKKAAIDKLVAPYARELGKLRRKRDSGAGLTTAEGRRYKQLLATIQELHKGR